MHNVMSWDNSSSPRLRHGSKLPLVHLLPLLAKSTDVDVPRRIFFIDEAEESASPKGAQTVCQKWRSVIPTYSMAVYLSRSKVIDRFPALQCLLGLGCNPSWKGPLTIQAIASPIPHNTSLESSHIQRMSTYVRNSPGQGCGAQTLYKLRNMTCYLCPTLNEIQRPSTGIEHPTSATRILPLVV